MTRFSRKLRTPVGLDVGARGLRAAQLRRDGAGWSVLATGSCERSGAHAGGEVLRPSAQLVRMVTATERFAGRDLVAVMSSPDVDYFSLELPQGVMQAGDEKIEQVVAAEVSRLLGCDSGDAVTRYWHSPASRPPSPNVVGIGALPDSVRKLLATADETRMSCSVVEPAALALIRLGAVLRPAGEDELWGMLDLGGRQARLVLGLGTVPVLGRAVGPGVADWTRVMAEALDVSEKSAEVHLREDGVVAPGGREAGQQASCRNSLAGLIMGALRSQLRSTTTEIERSVSYMKQCYPGCGFRGLIAVGGGSLIPNVVQYLEHALGFDIQRASAHLLGDTCGLSYSPDQGQPLELVALAMGASLST